MTRNDDHGVIKTNAKPVYDKDLAFLQEGPTARALRKGTLTNWVELSKKWRSIQQSRSKNASRFTKLGWAVYDSVRFPGFERAYFLSDEQKDYLKRPGVGDRDEVQEIAEVCGIFTRDARKAGFAINYGDAIGLCGEMVYQAMSTRGRVKASVRDGLVARGYGLQPYLIAQQLWVSALVLLIGAAMWLVSDDAFDVPADTWSAIGLAIVSGYISYLSYVVREKRMALLLEAAIVDVTLSRLVTDLRVRRRAITPGASPNIISPPSSPQNVVGKGGGGRRATGPSVGEDSSDQSLPVRPALGEASVVMDAGQIPINISIESPREEAGVKREDSNAASNAMTN